MWVQLDRRWCAVVKRLMPMVALLVLVTACGTPNSSATQTRVSEAVNLTVSARTAATPQPMVTATPASTVAATVTVVPPTIATTPTPLAVTPTNVPSVVAPTDTPLPVATPVPTGQPAPTATSAPTIPPAPTSAPAIPTPSPMPQPSTSYPGRIVYATPDNQVYITDSDGKGQIKIGSGNSPVFSPDGTRVAYVCDAKPGAPLSPSSVLAICTVNLDGSDMRSQCEGGTLAAATGLVRWSPGGGFIAKTTSQNLLGTVQLCDMTKGKLLDNLKYKQGSIEDIFDWTPDGNNAIWQSGWYGGVGGNLYYGDPTKFGEGAVQLTNGQNQVSRTDNFYSSARISPDGKTIAVAGANISFISVPGQRSPLDGRTLTGLGHVLRLAWSPDGKALVLFIAPTPNTWTVTVVDVASGNARVLTSGAAGYGEREAIDWSRQ